MAIVVSIGGSARTIAAGSFNLSDMSGQGKTFSCDVISADGSYTPEEGDEVLVTEGATNIFGGLVVTPSIRGIVGPFEPIVTSIACQSFRLYAQHAIVEMVCPTQGLHARLTALAALLSGSVTVDAGQTSPGPTMVAVDYRFVAGNVILDEWAVSNGMVWEITYTNKLKMYVPSTVAAAFDVSDNGSDLIGDVIVEPAGASAYCNRLYLKCGDGSQSGLSAVTQVFTQVGAEVEYVVTYRASDNIENTWPNVLIVDGAVESVVAWGVGDAVFQFQWDYLNHKMLNTGAALTAGRSISITYSPSSTFVIDDEAEQATYGRRVDGTAEAANVETAAKALELGNGIMAVRKIRPVNATYRTRLLGLVAGTLQTVTVPMRSLSGNYQVASVDSRDDIDGVLTRSVTVTTYTGPPPTFKDTYNKWGGGDGSSATGGGAYVLSNTSLPLIFLGASAAEYVESDSGPAYVAAGAVQVEINTAERGTTSAVVYVRLRASAGSVTARLRDMTNGATVGTSTAVSSTTFVTVVFAVAFTSGVATYELQLLPSIINTPVNGVGYLK